MNVEVVNVLSGHRRTLEVGRYVKNSFLVLWPMSTPIEIRRHDDGRLTSNPLRFFKQWQLTKESANALSAAIVERREQIKQQLLEDRYR